METPRRHPVGSVVVLGVLAVMLAYHFRQSPQPQTPEPKKVAAQAKPALPAPQRLRDLLPEERSDIRLLPDSADVPVAPVKTTIDATIDHAHLASFLFPTEAEGQAHTRSQVLRMIANVVTETNVITNTFPWTTNMVTETNYMKVMAPAATLITKVHTASAVFSVESSPTNKFVPGVDEMQLRGPDENGAERGYFTVRSSLATSKSRRLYADKTQYPDVSPTAGVDRAVDTFVKLQFPEAGYVFDHVRKEDPSLPFFVYTYVTPDERYKVGASDTVRVVVQTSGPGISPDHPRLSAYAARGVPFPTHGMKMTPPSKLDGRKFNDFLRENGMQYGPHSAQPIQQPLNGP